MKERDKEIVSFIYKLEGLTLDLLLEEELDSPEKKLEGKKREIYDEVVNDLYNIFDRLKEEY